MITQHNTPHGSVIERPEGWQYIGLFGHAVLSSVIKHNAMNNEAAKREILAIHKEVYSRKVGGVTVITEEETA